MMTRPLGVACVLSLAGCTATITTSVDIRHASPGIDIEQLAILPVSAQGSATRHRARLAEVATTELTARYPALEFLGVDESLEIIEGKGLAPSLVYLVDHSWEIDPRETNAVIALGEALESDYLLQLDCRHAAWMDTGLFSSDREGEDQSLHVRAFIWSTPDGEKVWEGTGRALSETGAYAKSSDVEDLLVETVRALVARLPIRGAQISEIP